MQQSNVIFGALAVAFVVFITTRGSLPVYMSVLFGTASSGDAAPSAPTSSPDAPASPGASGDDFGLYAREKLMGFGMWMLK